MPGPDSEIVDRVVRTVDSQITEVQPDSIPVHKLVMHPSGHGNLDAGEVRAAVDVAVE